MKDARAGKQVELFLMFYPLQNITSIPTTRESLNESENKRGLKTPAKLRRTEGERGQPL